MLSHKMKLMKTFDHGASKLSRFRSRLDDAIRSKLQPSSKGAVWSRTERMLYDNLEEKLRIIRFQLRREIEDD